MSTETRPSTMTSPFAAWSAAGGLSPDVLEHADRLGVAQYLPQVIDFTLEIFGSISQAFVMYDPEIPGDVHIMLDVPFSGSIEESLDKEDEWVGRLMQTIPRAPRVFALSVDFEP